jgi:hypothetical protein
MNSGHFQKWIFLGVFLLGCFFPGLSRAQSQAASPASVEVGGPFRAGWWLKTEWGVDYAMMGDVINGIKVWQSAVQSGGTPNTLSAGNLGLQGIAEVGLNLDPDNAFSIELQQITPQTEAVNYTDSGNNYTISVAPVLDSISLNYYRTLFQGGAFRTFAVIGGGWYHAQVNYFDGEPGSADASSATFTGDILGGSLEVGEEVAVNDNVFFGLNVKGILATFSQVTANSFIDNGQPATNNPPYALGIITAPGILTGALDAYSVPFASSTLRYAIVDFSGLSANVVLAYHF